MKTNISLLKKTVAALSLFGLISPIFGFGGDTGSAKKPLTEDQKIIHVLSRLGFGIRPGDVDRVRRMGIDKYIDQQLNPSSINDSVAESKVKGLDVFGMSTAEVFAKYPNPGALLRQLDGGKKAQAAKQQGQGQDVTKPGDGTQPGQPQDPNALTADEQRERRERLAQLYKEYDLRPAGQLMPQIVGNRILRDVYSERQLQEVMVDFWQNHFNVFAGKGALRWYIPSYERDVIRPNALGNFKDLVVATAKSPAMLFYLDNFESVSPNSQQPGNRNPNAQRVQQEILRNGGMLPPLMRDNIRRRTGMTDAEIDARLRQMRTNPQTPKPQQQKQQQKRGINENYARELMELHTLGVDGGYTQADIVEVAKCFTGWTIADPRGYRKVAANMIEGKDDRQLERLQRMAGVPDDLESGEFYFNERWHEGGTKTVLGQKVNEGGIKDGLKVIDILANSPATAHFIAKELAVKFVSDNPNEAYIGRIADAFHRSGGDIKTTLRAIFTDREFFATENYRAKIKTPYELAISSIRALGADTNGSPAMLAMLNKLGEVPYSYQAPTGYPDKAEDWVNTGALLERFNFAIAIASNRIPGTRVDLGNFASSDKTGILEKSVAQILNGEISASTKSTLSKQIEQPLPDVTAGSEPKMEDTDFMPAEKGKLAAGNRQGRLLAPTGDPDVFKVVSLVLGTPEFQRQ
jgi:uncharacterized protein (DUF1800 family)